MKFMLSVITLKNTCKHGEIIIFDLSKSENKIVLQVLHAS